MRTFNSGQSREYTNRSALYCRIRVAKKIPLLVVILVGFSAVQWGTGQAQTVTAASAQAANQDEWLRLRRRLQEAYRGGSLDDAVRLGEQAVDSAERSFGPDAPFTLTSLNDLAYLYESQGRYAAAEPLYLRALEASTRTAGRDNPETLIVANNLTALYHSQGRYAEAETLLLRTLEVREHRLGRNDSATILSINDLASLYQSQGRYAEAEPLYLRALEANEQTLGRDDERTLTVVGNLATLYFAQGRHAEAEALLLRAVEARERTLGGDHPSTLTSLINLAGLYHQRGRHAEAESLASRALGGFERRLGRDNPATLNAVNTLAAIYWDQGRYAEAEPLYLRAIEGRVRTVGRDNPETLWPVHNLAVLYRSQRRYAEAEPLNRQVLEVTQRIYGPGHPQVADAAEALALGRLLSGTEAASALEPARLLVSALRSRRTILPAGAYGEAQGNREEAQRGDDFSLLADAAWAAVEREPGERWSLLPEVFAALQDATAGTTNRAVLRMAARGLAQQRGSELGTMIAEREGLGDQWSTNNGNYSAALAGTEPRLEELRRNLRAERERIEVRMNAVDERLRHDFPQYFAMVRPEAVSLQSTQDLLASDEAILLIVPTRFGTHILGVSRIGSEWVRSTWTREQVAAAVQRLLWEINPDDSAEQAEAWRREDGPGYGFHRRTAHSLYREIIAPMEALLAGKRHVFIATGGALTSLPLGILVTEEPQGSDADPQALRATRWFADAHALVQIPSVQSLLFLRRFRPASARPQNGAETFIGFGDPALQGPPTRRARNRGSRGVAAASLFAPGSARSGAGIINAQQIRRMSRLPGTAVELENMRRALGAPRNSLFLRERATETNLRHVDLSATRILALATHGVVAGEMGGSVEPGLIFTPPANVRIEEQTAGEDDGLLTMSEISTLRLDADWVIMSACSTASGDGSPGAPGLSGLARAFFYAGARNLLASHWPVDDDVAPRLTVRTIALLRGHARLSRAEALQQAMREIREDRSHDAAGDTWAHPRAWAPFSLIGDGAH